MDPEPLLLFEDAGVKPGSEHEDGLDGASFALRPGERLLVLLDPLDHGGVLGDLAQGLTAPDRGRVLFEGRDWLTRPPDEAAAARARIGRVYERPLWVSNLDVDENITLVQRHHTLRPEGDIDAEAVRLARAFGLADLPRMRPARVPARELRVADWIRALLGERALLVLERPLRDAPPDKGPALIRAVRAASDHGAAVIWLQDAGERNKVQELDPARILGMTGARLAPAERT